MLSSATGEWTATVNPTRTSLTYTLTYSDLSTPVLFAHIHFGQPGVNGAVMPQGIRVANLDDVLAAIRTGRTYVNVHSMRSPGGEIRGRVRVEEDDD